MKLKRLYDRDGDGRPVRDDAGNARVIGVRVVRAGRRQNFSDRLVAATVADPAGWMSLGGGRLTVRGEAGDLVYRILRTPGAWCCHCGARFDKGREAQAHVAAEHAGVASPDESNPAGYAVLHHFECVLDDRQDAVPGTGGEDRVRPGDREAAAASPNAATGTADRAATGVKETTHG